MKKRLLSGKNKTIPFIPFYIRRDGGWTIPTAYDMFTDKKSLIIFLKGAYIDSKLLVHYDNSDVITNYNNTYCCCPNDSYVMNQWATDLNIKNIDMLPDGNKEFFDYLDLLEKETPIRQKVEISNSEIKYLGDVSV